MPRIARELDHFESTPEQERVCRAALGGNGSSTFDVCSSCFDKLGGEGAPWPDDPRLAPYNGDFQSDLVPFVILNCDEHPSYDEDKTTCGRCRKVLSDEVDG